MTLASSANSHPKSRPQINGRKNDNEAAIDIYATLFSPATPRASPEPMIVTTNAKASFNPALQSHHPGGTPGSFEDFGAFVSVPAAEDPLSSSFPSSDFSLPSPIQPTVSDPQRPRTLRHGRNASLNFFDKFAQDAKVAAEKNKRGVLDELLMHEDDPLYWLKDVQQSKPIDIVNKSALHDTSNRHSPQSEHGLPLDLDFDFFTRKSPSSSPPSIRRHRRPSHTSHKSQSPTSPTLARPTLAPPIASTSPVSSLASIPQHIHDPSVALIDDEEERPGAARSSSYQTLSQVSSRWMSSLLTSPRRPTLESVFAPEANATSHPLTDDSQPQVLHHAHPAAPLHLPSSLPPSTHIPLSHGTPFGPSTRVSPFASHTYIPPSGAPGFKGEAYDWDLGFSSELERELGVESGVAKERELVGVKTKTVHVVAKEHRAEVGIGMGVAQLMEKKSGNIELKGRRVGTVPVLMPGLPELMRPHLPALARLPRAWTLLYSLDQHGISLKTLYTRCEAQMDIKPGLPRSMGALIAVKDDRGGVFGVWVGEGIQMSRGKGYYGSGESFLWKINAGGELKVWKWTGKNDYVALCEPDFISFGGGDGQYGLYLDDTLFDGSTAPCPTFGNEPLCSSGPRKGGAVTFECVGLEVWGIGP